MSEPAVKRLPPKPSAKTLVKNGKRARKKPWWQRLGQPGYFGSGLAQMLLLATLVLAACGVGYFALDPAVETLEDGLWLAFTTASTVGYGDVIPTTRWSRLFSVVVVLGFAILSLVTASISAKLVGTQERRMERDILRDLHAQVRMLRQELAELKAQQAQLLARERHDVDQT
jgi:voltage-gated potassium channel